MFPLADRVSSLQEGESIQSTRVDSVRSTCYGNKRNGFTNSGGEASFSESDLYWGRDVQILCGDVLWSHVGDGWGSSG